MEILGYWLPPKSFNKDVSSTIELLKMLDGPMGNKSGDNRPGPAHANTKFGKLKTPTNIT